MGGLIKPILYITHKSSIRKPLSTIIESLVRHKSTNKSDYTPRRYTSLEFNCSWSCINISRQSKTALQFLKHLGDTVRKSKNIRTLSLTLRRCVLKSIIPRFIYHIHNTIKYLKVINACKTF
ncbi:unnamed protein product [Callosobruchus maculatus]|uniref:Uncharacterized protein n=1 Tax=Callosobruchus maculatus TaxID=64391 RepID=A0A653BHH8_CALMS|nr:unnamed protein product [Callosobruchus maculatus]